MAELDYSLYLSPFTWRYGGDKMRQTFSEESKFKTWRKIWVALAKAQHKAGLVSKEELKDLEANQNSIDIERIREIEKETKHDIVSAIKEFAEKATIGGGKIHLGATSMDIVDNAETIRVLEGLAIIEEKLMSLLSNFAKKIDEYADHPSLGYTHLQAAEPTTIGYRLSFYARDLLMDLTYLRFVRSTLRSKGFKGAVGTSASYVELLKDTRISSQKLEKEVMDELGLEPALITSQVHTRKFDFWVLSMLASIASSIAKFASDLRILQSPGFGEWEEPFYAGQVGSSAMPFKKNPLNAEKINSLTKYVSRLPEVALENASETFLERTLDDSANKRIIIPESFLAVDEILHVGGKILAGISFNEARIKYNLEQFAPFAATEKIILEAVKNGADRQEMHELIRQIALKAWDRIQKGRSNPMKILLCQNKELLKYVKVSKIIESIKVSQHVGDAPDRARMLVKKIKENIK